MLEGFTDWLSNTELSAFFADTNDLATWLIIPTSQSIHIVCVAFVMISVAILNLRILGFGVTRQSFGQLTQSLMPWIWISLIVLFLTGVVQTIAEPGRELLNIGFRTKMVMLAITVAITIVYERTVRKDPHYWDHSPERRRIAKVLASTSLVLWVCIVAAGRLIAYMIS